MNKILALAAGVSGIALSLPSFAGVSYVFVSNTGDQSLSLVRCVTSNGKNPIKCDVKDRQDVGFGASWPANQYRGHPAWWWTGLSGEVIGVKAKASLSPLKQEKNIVSVDTYNIAGLPDSGSNFTGISPGGRTAWNSAREVDRIQEIDTNPDSPSFGTILSEIFVPDQDPTSGPTESNGAARPCDATITPDGRFFMEPDLGGESLTVVDTQTKQIIHQVLPPRAYPDERVLPFMSTTNGKIVLVENLEGQGTYDIWDVSGLPAQVAYEKKLTQDDGLGVDAQTSEFTPDGRYAYLIMRGVRDAEIGSPEASRLDVLDVDESSPTYLQIVNNIDLPFNCRASTGDFSNDGAYFFISCRKYEGNGEFVAIDNATQRVVLNNIALGPSPRGVVVR